MTTVSRWDPADYVESPEDVLAYLKAALDENDAKLFARVLGIVARSKGMTEMARRAGVSREALYKGFTGDSDPRLSTVMGVLKATGYHLSIEPVVAEPA